MFQKHNRFYADWRDKRGVRHRKSFTTAEAAIDHETSQKDATRPKLKGAAKPLQRQSAPISQRGKRSGGGTGEVTPQERQKPSSKSPDKPIARRSARPR